MHITSGAPAVAPAPEPSSQPSVAERVARRYLDLLKRSLTGYLAFGGTSRFSGALALDGLYRDFTWQVPTAVVPRTLLTEAQLDSLERAIRTVVADNVSGDILEAGVWRGGASMYARAVLAALGVHDRCVWLADTFSGIPVTGGFGPAEPVDEWSDRWVASLDDVTAAFERYQLLDEQVQFIVGPFAESLGSANPARLSVLRLDADSYASTTQALEALYPRISPGGFVIVDDWHLPSARSAVIAYRRKYGIKSPVQPVFGRENDTTLYEVQWRAE